MKIAIRVMTQSQAPDSARRRLRPQSRAERPRPLAPGRAAAASPSHVTSRLHTMKIQRTRQSVGKAGHWRLHHRRGGSSPLLFSARASLSAAAPGPPAGRAVRLPVALTRRATVTFDSESESRRRRRRHCDRDGPRTRGSRTAAGAAGAPGGQDGPDSAAVRPAFKLSC